MGKNGCSIVFIGNDEDSNANWSHKRGNTHNALLYFTVPPTELPYRILASLVPPIVGSKFRQVYVDLLGPTLALLVMAALLHYGHATKLPAAATTASPTEILILYASLMPILSYVLSHLGKSRIAFLETVSLLGYSLFGHVFTLCMSLLCYQETNHTFFFACLMIFGGLSALRVALVLLASIPLPAARLLVCSVVATLHLLFLVFIHFTYMHRTFVYGVAVNSLSKKL